MSRQALRGLPQKSFLITHDQELLSQLQRLFPAVMAGFCIWTGKHESEVWVKWHWYYDSQINQFIVPAHGITSNVVLVSHEGTGLSAEHLSRFALRRIRRRYDWQPWLDLRQIERSSHRRHRQINLTDPPLLSLQPLAEDEPPLPAPTATTQENSPILTLPLSLDDIALLRLIDDGLIGKQIQDALGISEATLYRRLRALRQTLGVHHTAQLPDAARRKNLL